MSSTDPTTAADRYKAALLAMSRIVNEAARKEREMWLRVVKELKKAGVI